jgi:hypothetical protein
VERVLDDFLVRRSLVAFQPHDIVSTLVDDLFGDRSLASHRIDGKPFQSSMRRVNRISVRRHAGTFAGYASAEG